MLKVIVLTRRARYALFRCQFPELPMRDFLNRIWLYLNYPPDTHRKVEEIRQGMLNRSDYFSRRAQNTWKMDAAIENFRNKVAVI